MLAEVMEFEWDENKRAITLRKHGIDFPDAASIWRHPAIDPYASRIAHGELRHLAIGWSGNSNFVIAVVYTFRGPVRRLITARKARNYEREDYESFLSRLAPGEK